MKVVIDTNVIFNMIKPTGSCYWMLQALEYQKLTLCVTTDILAEYEEILTQKYSAAAVNRFFYILDLLPNVRFQLKSYYFRLIPVDQDDEKFVDCAIASGAAYLVTNDKHFDVIKKVPFPKIRIVNDKEFALICKEKGILQ
jgi:uncharacterized protein